MASGQIPAVTVSEIWRRISEVEDKYLQGRGHDRLWRVNEYRGMSIPSTLLQNTWAEDRRVSELGENRMYLHASGAAILADNTGGVLVDRGLWPESRRAADHVENWLVHIGYQLAQGIFSDQKVRYRSSDGVSFWERDWTWANVTRR